MRKSLVSRQKKQSSIPIIPVTRKHYKTWLRNQSQHIINWLESTQFNATQGRFSIIPTTQGLIQAVVVVTGDTLDIWSFAGLPANLPAHLYHIDLEMDAAQATASALGWALGSYQFTVYKKSTMTYAKLVYPDECDVSYVSSMAGAIHWARDMINMPANDMTPARLAQEAVDVAITHKARCNVISGEGLIKHNYPLIFAVGKASSEPPRLVDIRWGRTNAPKVTLVGKGVSFDSGGLDIKSSSNMRLMKKDMGGAACVLALARVIMESELDIRLRVLIPAVENAISGNAMRPLDIVRSRKGLTVEIGNTDAEGRLILCDALADADDESPELLIDCATLTGAARVALGTDVPVFFTADNMLAADLMRHSTTQSDPLYRLPLWDGYRDKLDSAVADINNDPDSSYGGAITAALYLREFVQQTKQWVHIDMMAWNLSSRSGRPSGGEAMAVRALYALIKERYGARR